VTNFWKQYAINVRRNLEMFYKKYANKYYSGEIQFEFEELEFVVEGKPYYGNGTAIINYEAESDDFGRLFVKDYEIYQIHEAEATDYDGYDAPVSKEMITEIVKILDDTPQRQEAIYEKIFEDIDWSKRD
jgi:hypothetical protein